MPEGKFRGYGFESCIAWLDREENQDVKEAVLAALPDEFKAEIPKLTTAGWYPLSWLDTFARAVADARGTTAEEKFAVAEEIGMFIARDNLSSVLKLLLKFVTPTALPKQLPKLWKKYYDSGEVFAVDLDEENSACVEVRGFPGLRYTAPIVAGWIKVAYELLNVSDFEIKEVNNPLEEENPTDFRWEFRWTT